MYVGKKNLDNEFSDLKCSNELRYSDQEPTTPMSILSPFTKLAIWCVVNRVPYSVSNKITLPQIKKV